VQLAHPALRRLRCAGLALSRLQLHAPRLRWLAVDAGRPARLELCVRSRQLRCLRAECSGVTHLQLRCPALRRLCLDAPVRGVQVLGSGGAARALEHVRDAKGHVQGACQVSANGWALVRPDGYLAATGETINAQLVRAIERSLGLRGDQP
ncbi:MAG: hypothetical protein ACK4F6_19100, partial [Hylemonella sp.]